MHGPRRFGLARTNVLAGPGRSIAVFPLSRPSTTTVRTHWRDGIRRETGNGGHGVLTAGVTRQQRAVSEQLFATFSVENIVRSPPSRCLCDSAPAAPYKRFNYVATPCAVARSPVNASWYGGAVILSSVPLPLSTRSLTLSVLCLPTLRLPPVGSVREITRARTHTHAHTLKIIYTSSSPPPPLLDGSTHRTNNDDDDVEFLAIDHCPGLR